MKDVATYRQQYIKSLADLRYRLIGEEESVAAHCPPSSGEYIRVAVDKVMKARAKYSQALTLGDMLKHE
ncbi:MAG: hypothetical protein E6R03_18540 [Hyphomicrobiaceae bacterium]|nr:MAG: hypothetical protein E6R03_18540 [Hyphomicrobiaceae bacterium]